MTDIEILKEGIKALDSKKADDIRILKVRERFKLYAGKGTCGRGGF